MEQVLATSIAGVPFDKSQRLENGLSWYVLKLRDMAKELVLATAWVEFWKADQLKVIWPAGPLTLQEMIAWGNRPDVAMFGAFIQAVGSNDIQFAGLGWAMSMTPVGKNFEGADVFKAELGFCFLPALHGTGLPQDLAEAMIDYGFSHLNIEAMYGTTPMPNTLARLFAKRLGFNKLAVFPAYGCWPDKDGVMRPCDCEINVITRQQWLNSGLAYLDQHLEEAITKSANGG